MHYYTVHYKFSQSFQFSVQAAYDWATDYDEDDLSLMGFQGKREIERVDSDTLVLYDTYFSDGRTTRKKRLVRMFPELLMLTNTRLAGPMKHSQFVYQFVAEGKNRSRLDFTGAQVERSAKKPSPGTIAALSRQYAREDSVLWVNLAKAMEKDLGARR
jgi:hypothetical protein